MRDEAHWDELQRLFDLCAELPEADRLPALNLACADPVLRERVIALLAACDRIESASNVPPPPPLIGPYRIIRELGAGGLGVVYLVERLADGSWLRFALKLLAPSVADGAFMERFRREVQTLAALEHPNITRLLDAGWSADGRPYLVMEFVDGVQVDAFCDAARMSVPNRLNLFLRICDAIDYAHRNMILHLDLKPSNVLVSATGTVKLLDFGTSKFMHPGIEATIATAVTPAYASPEQILGRPVSAASDVFGLGAVLFALLSGGRPFGDSSLVARIERATQELDPDSLPGTVTAVAAAARGQTPVRLRRLLGGDLDAIVGKCLRHRPQDRYASVDALGEEIRRYLRGKPVLARRQTWRYRSIKFLRRHRLGLGLGSAVLAAILASVGFAWVQQQRALREAERAVRMQTYMSRLFKMANPENTGKPVATVPDLLRVGMSKLPAYIHDPADLRSGQLALAESMFDSGSLDEALAAFASIKDSAKRSNASADFTEAEIFIGQILCQQGHLPEGRKLLADALADSRLPNIPWRLRVLAKVYYAWNEDNNGFRKDENLLLLQAAAKEAEQHGLAPRDAALAVYDLAMDLQLRGQGNEAKPIFEHLLTLYAGDPLALCDRSAVYGWLAWIDHANGDSAASLPTFKKAYDGFIECEGPDSPGALDQLPYWADALMRLSRANEAVQLLENAMPTWRRVVGGSTDNSDMLMMLARAYVATDRYGDAETTARELLALLTGKVAERDRTMGLAHLVLAEALAGQRRNREALPHADIAVSILVPTAVTAYARAFSDEALHLQSRLQGLPTVRELLNAPGSVPSNSDAPGR
jgi:serine/threonine-protein kinase